MWTVSAVPPAGRGQAHVERPPGRRLSYSLTSTRPPLRPP